MVRSPERYMTSDRTESGATLPIAPGHNKVHNLLNVGDRILVLCQAHGQQRLFVLSHKIWRPLQFALAKFALLHDSVHEAF